MINNNNNNNNNDNNNKQILLDCNQTAKPFPKRCSSKGVFCKYAVNPQKCDFNKVALQLFRDHTSTWVFTYEFTAYF